MREIFHVLLFSPIRVGEVKFIEMRAQREDVESY